MCRLAVVEIRQQVLKKLITATRGMVAANTEQSKNCRLAAFVRPAFELAHELRLLLTLPAARVPRLFN
jgi:hypothetical protein